jgi:hypothetical protein
VNVSACLVTRGDVDMQPILESLPPEWETVIYDNGAGMATTFKRGIVDEMTIRQDLPDLAVYGRYAAIEHAHGDLIYVQDDDVIVSDPQAIVDEWLHLRHNYPDGHPRFIGALKDDHAVLNMPPEFRPHYPDSGLVGFGACFHRDAPARAFGRYFGTDEQGGMYARDMMAFNRRADNVFTTLAPRVLVDVPKTDLPYASDPSRMWKQPGHTAERDRMIELARKVRDA